VNDNFLLQHINLPTRGRGCQTPSLLDLVFTEEEQDIQQLMIEAPLGLSDHSVLMFKMSCMKEVEVSSITKYVYDKGDYASLRRELEDIDWKGLFENSMHLDVEKQWQFFKSKYNELIDKYVPKRKFTADPVDQSKRTGSYTGK